MFSYRAHVHRSAAVLLAVLSIQADAARVDDAMSVLSPPAMAALAADLEARGLMADFYRPDGLLVGDGRFTWYYGRVVPVAVPAGQEALPGLHRRPRAQPAGTYDYVLVFDDDAGRRMQQLLAPASPNWSALHSALSALPGVTEVTQDDEDISVVIDGRRVYGRLEHRASLTIADYPFPSEQALLGWAGDLNGDGAGDYYVIYPYQSLAQAVYVYPLHP